MYFLSNLKDVSINQFLLLSNVKKLFVSNINCLWSDRYNYRSGIIFKCVQYGSLKFKY